MILYLLFFGSQILAIAVSRLFGVKNNISLLITLILTTVLFAGLRGNVGTDTFAYRDYYNKVGDEAQDVFFEPTFFFLSLFGKAVGLDSQFLIFSVALLQGIFIYLSIKIIKEKDLYYCLVLSTYYATLNLNLIRVGLAIYILGYALLLRDSGKALQSKLAATLATVTHFSTLIALPFFWKKLYYLLVPLILIYFVDLRLISEKFSAYFLGGNLVISDFQIGIGFFVTNLLFLMCLHKEQLIFDRLVIVVFTVFLMFKLASFSINIFDRIAIVFEFMFVTLLLNKIKYNQSRIIIIIIIIYSIYKSIAFIEASDEAMQTLILEYPGLASLYRDTHWIPYEFFWELNP